MMTIKTSYTRTWTASISRFRWKRATSPSAGKRSRLARRGLLARQTFSLPFDVRTFNTEYRNGVDAVRFQRPWGDLGEIDIGVVLGKDAKSENSAAFLQLRTNHKGADYHLAIIEFAAQQLTGLGLQTAIWDLGFWLEAAYVNGDENYLRLSTGVDYSFSENTFAADRISLQRRRQ